MTDRELLEMAAKAAGISPIFWNDDYGHGIVDGEFWNPLTDDGDAFRLAVKLGIELHDPYQYNKACAWLRAPMVEFWENLGDDPYAATRRAIVRAAAEIAKQEGADHGAR